VAIIPAAGLGLRMGADVPKQFLGIDDTPIMVITLRAFQESDFVNGIILVVPARSVDLCRDKIVEKYSLSKVIKIVPGGKRRQDSVRHGLEATEGRYDMVVIHDAVRPLVSPMLIDTVIKEAKVSRAVVTGLPSKDTVKEVNDSGYVVRTHDRKHVWLIQTPQAFYYRDLIMAHQRAIEDNWEESTDDAALMEKIGIPVKVVTGAEDNIKVTTPHDLNLARFFMKIQ
jgi:2-C-methyl-D-erythritol 4-phosphate cytidylyltransferase